MAAHTSREIVTHERAARSLLRWGSALRFGEEAQPSPGVIHSSQALSPGSAARQVLLSVQYHILCMFPRSLQITSAEPTAISAFQSSLFLFLKKGFIARI